MLAKFFGSWILKDCIKVQEKKTKVVVLRSCPRQNVNLGTSRCSRATTAKKKYLLIFCRSRCRRRRRCLSSLRIWPIQYGSLQGERRNSGRLPVQRLHLSSPAKTSVSPRSSPLGTKRPQRRRARRNGCFRRLHLSETLLPLNIFWSCQILAATFTGFFEKLFRDATCSRHNVGVIS